VGIANCVILTGELICLKFADEGCNVAINYNSSADKAAAVAKKVEQDHGTRAFTIQGVSKASPAAFPLAIGSLI
jgi:NAD(P)-dependent dehydrogenase (short-subunit alcohol dehydrogenase family)